MTNCDKCKGGQGKLTDEQLSRILGEHAAELLVVGGAENWRAWSFDGGCALQAAFNEPNPSAADRLDPRSAYRFDEYYRPNMSPEELLELVLG